MWAQIIKTRFKAGKEGQLDRLVEMLKTTEQPGSGLLRSSSMRDQKDPRSLYMMVVFESEEKARAREQDPRRTEGLNEARALMADMFDGAPEFVDLDILHEWTPDSTTAKNKARFSRIMDECFTAGNLDGIGELFSPNWVNIDPALPVQLSGHDGARELITMFHTAFPDFFARIDDMIAEGDRVSARITFGGTHQGELMGIPPTGNRVEVTGTGIFRFADGKDVEHQMNFNSLALMQQIGVVPVMERSAS